MNQSDSLPPAEVFWRILQGLVSTEVQHLKGDRTGVIQFEFQAGGAPREFRYLELGDGRVESHLGVSPRASAWIEVQEETLARTLQNSSQEIPFRTLGDATLVEGLFAALDRTQTRTSWIGARITERGER